MSARRLAVAGLLTVALFFDVSHAPAAPVIGSQTSDPSLLTLERIYSATEFGTQRFGPARWLADGSGYTTVEASTTFRGGDDIVRYDPETGEREVLVSAGRLFLPPQDILPQGTSQGRQAFLSIDDYAWSDDGTKLLLYTNSQRVWRQNTRGDYWVLDLESGDKQQLGGGAEPATLMFAKFSGHRTPHQRAHREQQAVHHDGLPEPLAGIFAGRNTTHHLFELLTRYLDENLAPGPR